MTSAPEIIPDELWARVAEFLPEAAQEAYMGFLHEPPRPLLVMNRLRLGASKLLERLVEDGFSFVEAPGFFSAYRLSEEDLTNLKGHPVIREGWAILREAADLLPVELLGAYPRERFLDLAPDEGENLLMAAIRMGQQGRLTAVEPFRLRFAHLEKNLGLWGVYGARIKQVDVKDYGRTAAARYHRVLLSVAGPRDQRPALETSGSRPPWGLERLEDLVLSLEAQLISALESLRPGAVCLYAIQSFLPEVCEGVVDHAARRFQGEVAVEPLKWPVDLELASTPGVTRWLETEFDPSMENARRILPQGDVRGMFVCRMRRLMV